VGSTALDIEVAGGQVWVDLGDEDRLALEIHPGPAELAAGFLACAIGVLFEGLLDPELDAEAVYAGTFELLSGGAVQPSPELAASGSPGRA